MVRIVCNDCGAEASSLDWRCANCGGLLDWTRLPRFDPARIAADDFSLWRYRAMLPVTRRFSLGEGMTPLVPLQLEGARLRLKLEYLNPTGSFKDRGVAVMLNHLACAGADAAMDNSSGNAGAALAAYAALAGHRRHHLCASSQRGGEQEGAYPRLWRQNHRVAQFARGHLRRRNDGKFTPATPGIQLLCWGSKQPPGKSGSSLAGWRRTR